MIKCFLSHSSKDKDYVRTVAQQLGKEVVVFDEATFEPGMGNREEIIRGLDESSLFVLFISGNSLDSSWVQEELARAKEMLDESRIHRIFPIIIDKDINHKDERIPDWMRREFNLQFVTKPAVAVRKIRARRMELAWEFHPKIKERQEIFVGRNDLLQQIEQRLDDYNEQYPIALIASGLPAIGRRSLLKFSLKKASLVRDSYEFPMLLLSPSNNIEDFLYKIADLGLTEVGASDVIRKIAEFTVRQKIDYAKDIVKSIVEEKERVLIEDRGVIVQSDGVLVDWFDEILTDLSSSVDHLTFCIVSQFRPSPSINRKNPAVYSVSVNELSDTERRGLLGRYAKFHGLEMGRDDLSFFSDLLTGYPEQVFYAVDLILDEGIHHAKKHSHLIQEYGSSKAQVVLNAFNGKERDIEFIYFLSKFEFLSYSVLFSMVDESTYMPILKRLVSMSVCERFGSSRDYIRVNETVRDFVSRSRFGQTTAFDLAVQKHVQKFISKYKEEELDVSDYIFSAQEALKRGGNIPASMLVPSVYVDAVKSAYEEYRDYPLAVSLASKVLSREKCLHDFTITNVRFILCQSLARLNDVNRFFDEVSKLSGFNKSFLLGFYYRLSWSYEKAEYHLLRALSESKRGRDPRVLGELVLVYMQGDEYDKALEMARENYERRNTNPINANNYFACLVSREKSADNRRELESIVDRLEANPSEKAREVVASMRARIEAYFDNDRVTAFGRIESAIQKYPSVRYPLLTKADLALHFRDSDKLNEAIKSLSERSGGSIHGHRSVAKYKAMLLAMEGKIAEAKRLVSRELKGLPLSALQRLNERIDSFAQGRV